MLDMVLDALTDLAKMAALLVAGALVLWLGRWIGHTVAMAVLGG